MGNKSSSATITPEKPAHSTPGGYNSTTTTTTTTNITNNNNNNNIDSNNNNNNIQTKVSDNIEGDGQMVVTNNNTTATTTTTTKRSIARMFIQRNCGGDGGGNENSNSNSATPKKLKKQKRHQDPLLEEIKLKIGKLAKEEIVTKIEDKVLQELQNTPRYQHRQLITKPMWRESIHSLKPIDTIYRVSFCSVFFYIFFFCYKSQIKVS